MALKQVVLLLALFSVVAPAFADVSTFVSEKAGNEEHAGPEAIPERVQNILDTIAAAGKFSKFVHFVKLLELGSKIGELRGTLLVPTDEAFSLASEQIQAILSKSIGGNGFTRGLDNVLLSHFIKDRITPQVLEAAGAARLRRFKATGPSAIMSTRSVFGDLPVSVVSDGIENGFLAVNTAEEDVAMLTTPNVYVDFKLAVQGVDRLLLPSEKLVAVQEKINAQVSVQAAS